jgi:methyl-accepting chemotaxis protein
MKPTLESSLTEFGQSAVALDAELKRFERLGRELESLTIDSDKGMSRGRELFTELADCREQLGAKMKEMSRTLGEARERNEKAEHIIAERAQAWEARQAETERLQARFKTLGDSVHHLNDMVTEFRRPIGESVSATEQEKLRLQLNQTMEPLATLVEEAKNLVQEARSANMKTLERNADTLRQSLQAARNRLSLMMERGTSLPN